jgi:hypothetical protein
MALTIAIILFMVFAIMAGIAVEVTRKRGA